MQFCKDCGVVLNLLEFPDEELCYSCRKKNEVRPKPQAGRDFLPDSLMQATLSCENHQLMLRSPEGWLLWSGSDQEKVSMEQIMKRADRILAIRSKRVKK